MGRERVARAPILLFFFASGATGLVLEVAWTRILGAVFGNTVYAASTVLTAYMLGLALGSLALGRTTDRLARPLVLYGLLEIGVGAYALAFPFLSALTSDFYTWFYRAAAPGAVALTAVRFLLSAALLVPPTFCMGGTLPALGRHLSLRAGNAAQEVGYLYGVNTLGAVLGCMLAGFVLIRVMGIQGTLVFAAGIAMCIGACALVLGRRAASSPDADAPCSRPRRGRPDEAPSTATYALLMAAFATTGFCALAAEVLWTRVLLFVLTTTVYSFATMLATLLVGLGAGSYIASRWIVPRMARPRLWFGIIELLAGLAVLATLPLLANLGTIDIGFAQRFGDADPRWILLVRLLDASAVLLPPSLCMGMAFPVLACACLRGEKPLGARIGQMYAANTIGCVLGSFSAGFVLLPAFGAAVSLLGIAALNLLAGIAVAWGELRRAPLVRFALGVPAAALLAGAFLATPADVFHATINTYHHPSAILFLEEHTTATVSVHELSNKDRLIATDGVDVAGLDFMLRTTQKLQGYIPLLLHPDPRRVVQIGFGSGETARVGMEFGVPDYTVVEISPAVFHAGAYFDAINGGSYRDPRVHKRIMDGKNFALLDAGTYDIVMNDSIYPGSSGSSALYTVDHFRNCRERLAEGGLFSCWVPLDLKTSELRMILKSFQRVFPHTSLWVASNCLNKHSLFLGSLTPLRIDLARIQAAMRRPAIRADLAQIAIDDAYDLLDCHVADEDAIRRLVADAPVTTDDRPLLEFSCALRLPWEQCCMDVFRMLRECRVPVTPFVANFANEAEDRAALARRFEATNLIFEGLFAQLAGFPETRREKFEQALAANPGEAHVRTCQDELAREIADLTGALGAYPGSSELAFRLADKLFVALRTAEAARLYESLTDRSPSPPPRAFVRLAQILSRGGEVPRAKNVLLKCLSRWPRSAEAHDWLARLYHKTGNADAAIRHITEALVIDPGNELYEHHKAVITAGP